MKVKISSLIALVLGVAVGHGVFELVDDLRSKQADPTMTDESGLMGWDTALGSMPRFTDVSDESGISFTHNNGLTGKHHLPEIMGAGVALFDYDRDGLLDIYFVNGNNLLADASPDLTNVLYHNNGDGSFSDTTTKAGVGDTGFGQGCCTADFDNDGDTDLYVTNLGANTMYRNNGDGTFEMTTTSAGLDDPGWGQSCSFLDYDNDGWLDLYVQNYLTYSLSMTIQAYMFIGGEKYLDYPTPTAFKGAPDHLYRNQGDGTFSDVTEKSGLYSPDGRGMGSACADFDDDGDIDIFVTNDTHDNYLFQNQGDGTFEEIGLAAGVAYGGNGNPEGSMGVGLGDFDGDQRMDLIVPCVVQEVFTLYRNLGDHWNDVSWPAGLAQATSTHTGFSPAFLDYDNDRDLDLFFSNGLVRSDDAALKDTSYVERYGQTDLLLANDGQGRFVGVGLWAGDHFARKLIGRGTAIGDLDNDGDLDIVISNLTGRPSILRNDTRSGHWIGLILVPRSGNRDGLGCSAWVEAGGQLQRSVVHGNVAYLSQNDRRLHFGLGEAEIVDRLEILWLDGQRQVFEAVAVDRFVTVEQGEMTLLFDDS